MKTKVPIYKCKCVVGVLGPDVNHSLCCPGIPYACIYFCPTQSISNLKFLLHLWCLSSCFVCKFSVINCYSKCMHQLKYLSFIRIKRILVIGHYHLPERIQRNESWSDQPVIIVRYRNVLKAQLWVLTDCSLPQMELKWFQDEPTCFDTWNIKYNAQRGRSYSSPLHIQPYEGKTDLTS